MKNNKQVLIIISIVLIVVVLLGVSYYAYRRYNSHNLLYKHYYERVDMFESENIKLKENGVDVLFLGDSLTEMYDLDYFYPQFKTANRGINGDTTFMLYDRLDVSAYVVQPKVCVMLIGTNNYRDMFENYEQILIDLQKNLPDTKIVILSLTPVSKGWTADNTLVKSHNTKIKELANKYSYTYVDVFTPLYDSDNDSLRADFALDVVHLNHEGYKTVTDKLTPILEDLIR